MDRVSDELDDERPAGTVGDFFIEHGIRDGQSGFDF
jgi:hypothetical protein